MTITKHIASALVIVTLASCTDARFAQITSIGSAAHIRCYSGSLLIYEGDSTGKVATERNSDGWFFKDAKSGKLMRISGSCVVEN